MSVIAAAVITGAAATAYSANKASSAQKSATKTAAASADYAADLSYDLGQQELDFAKQQYNDMKPLATQVSNAQLGLMGSQQTFMDESARQARDYYNYQVGTFQPLEKGLVADAANFSSDAYRNQLATQAAADAGRAFSNTQAASQRAMASMGVNPNSGKFAAMSNQNALGLAAQRAQAMTSTRQQADQLGWARRLDAAGLGRNLAGASNAAYGTAGSLGNNSSGAGSAALTSAMAPGVQYMQGLNQGSGTMMQGALANSQAMTSLASIPNQSASIWGAMGGTLMGAGIQGLSSYYGMQALAGIK